MLRKNILAIFLVLVLGVCMTGCTEKTASTSASNSEKQEVQAGEPDTTEEEKEHQFAGPGVTDVNPEEQGSEEGAGEFSAKKSGITWYVDAYTTVLKYEGEIAEQFAKDYYDGKNVDLTFEFAPDGMIEVRKHTEAGHLQFSYNINGKAGMFCDGFDESMVSSYGCSNNLEICGAVEDGAIYVCIYRNGIPVSQDDYPHVMITYCDYDNMYETMLNDQCGSSSQQFSSDVPAMFTGKVAECQNIYSLGDFSFANTGKAKTDDYQLNMGHENYIELISYNEAGKVVDVIGFNRNPETGEVIESEGTARGKYLDFQNFTASKSIFAYPVYFSKPYLTPSQFEGMEDY